MLVRVVINALALAAATVLLNGISLTATSTTERAFTLLIVAVIFGLVNAIVKPVMKFFSSCLLLITLGLFILVINGALLLLTSWLADQLGLGWHVDGFETAVLGSIIVSIVSFLVSRFIDKDEKH